MILTDGEKKESINGFVYGNVIYISGRSDCGYIDLNQSVQIDMKGNKTKEYKRFIGRRWISEININKEIIDRLSNGF